MCDAHMNIDTHAMPEKVADRRTDRSRNSQEYDFVPNKMIRERSPETRPKSKNGSLSGIKACAKLILVIGGY